MIRMNKNKIISIAIFVCLISLFEGKSIAQGFYINAGGGYGLQMASLMVANNNSSSNGPNNHIGVYDSYGAGLNFGIAVGYQFSKHISAEINGNYLIGAYINNSNSQDSANKGNNTYKQVANTARATMLRLIPAIKLSMLPDDFTPYIKAGVVIGLMPAITGNSTETDKYSTTLPTITSSDTIYTKNYKYSGGASIGGMAAIGVDINVADFFMI